MIATYKWEVEQIIAKKIFTDKNNNIRNNVIKDILLSYTGKFTNDSGEVKEEQEKIKVSLDIIDLSNFKPIDELSKQEILDIALSKLNPKEKIRIEDYVTFRCGDLEDISNSVTITLDNE